VFKINQLHEKVFWRDEEWSESRTAGAVHYLTKSLSEVEPLVLRREKNQVSKFLDRMMVGKVGYRKHPDCTRQQPPCLPVAEENRMAQDLLAGKR